MSGEKSGFPDQAAAAYPPEGTSAAAYPPEGTSGAAYPPAQYPAQTQPAAYPPPAYAPARTEDNVQTTVVVHQPQARPVYIQRSSGDYGSSATILAVCTTAFILICGCWWSLPCAIAAVFLGITAGAATDDESARKRSNSSVVCSIVGWVLAVVGLAILIGIAFGLNGGNATVTTTSSRNRF